jgi:hypothetical protein
MAVGENFEELARLLPPPPGDVAVPPWEQSEPEVGLRLPSDYREFVGRYGGGTITWPVDAPRFFVHVPCAVAARPDDLRGFHAFVDTTDSDIGSLFDGMDEDEWGGVVYSMRPNPGGLLAWGENEDGDYFFWLTEDPDPDCWPIVMWARGPATTYRFEGGMVAFLLGLFKGGLPASQWLSGPRLKWTMTSDWLRRGLEESAGPGA